MDQHCHTLSIFRPPLPLILVQSARSSGLKHWEWIFQRNSSNSAKPFRLKCWKVRAPMGSREVHKENKLRLSTDANPYEAGTMPQKEASLYLPSASGDENQTTEKVSSTANGCPEDWEEGRFESALFLLCQSRMGAVNNRPLILEKSDMIPLHTCKSTIYDGTLFFWSQRCPNVLPGPWRTEKTSLAVWSEHRSLSGERSFAPMCR